MPVSLHRESVHVTANPEYDFWQNGTCRKDAPSKIRLDWSDVFLEAGYLMPAAIGFISTCNQINKEMNALYYQRNRFLIQLRKEKMGCHGCACRRNGYHFLQNLRPSTRLTMTKVELFITSRIETSTMDSIIESIKDFPMLKFWVPPLTKYNHANRIRRACSLLIKARGPNRGDQWVVPGNEEFTQELREILRSVGAVLHNTVTEDKGASKRPIKTCRARSFWFQLH